MSFEDALDRGDLERAATVLEELVLLPDTGGLWIPECYADLARAYDRRGRCDEAIAAMEQAIDHGWRCVPDARSDIAEFLLRAGRSGEAAAIWAELKEKDSDDVWLYNAAGLSYGEVGEHELAIEWLGHGIELAMRTGDPEGITAQLSASRRDSLEALGRDHDELEQRVEPFLEDWRVKEHTRMRGVPLANHRAPARASLRDEADAGPGIVAALAWFPSGDYERAIERWPSLADDWGDVPHDDYCHRFEGHVKWMRANGVQVRAVAPIVLEDYVAWCEEHGEDPEEARAKYAAQCMADGDVIWWPPGRNEPCWCGSQRKYKKCCGPAAARPMHDPQS